MAGCFAGQLKLLRLIHSGSFGDCYVAEDLKGGNGSCPRLVAVKIGKAGRSAPQVLNEARVYALLGGCVNVPKVHAMGVENGHNFCVMDLLGQNLDDLLDLCHGRFTLKTTICVIDGVLSALEFVHSKHFVHRDVKPANILEAGGRFFLIDFGFAKKWRDPATLAHVARADSGRFTGTVRFASVNSMRGGTQSRRDDLISLFYVAVLLANGSLPWMGLPDVGAVLEAKAATSVEDLTRGLPPEFGIFGNAAHGLGFTDPPDYAGYRAAFRSLFLRSGFVWDRVYDWTGRPPG